MTMNRRWFIAKLLALLGIGVVSKAVANVAEPPQECRLIRVNYRDAEIIGEIVDAANGGYITEYRRQHWLGSDTYGFRIVVTKLREGKQ